MKKIYLILSAIFAVVADILCGNPAKYFLDTTIDINDIFVIVIIIFAFIPAFLCSQLSD